MDSVVLVKVVPDLDDLRVDPATGLARREGVDLFLNPFDQRALRVALDLRRPTEKVTVVSMGPPSAERALHETRGLGADRSILITDPALAGSDTLVTARVLAKALGLLGSDLVLMGRWTTDSETGQVPPQLAELLDRPFVPAARRIARTDDGGLEVDSDTEEGWAAEGVLLPAVVSVGEKITKIRKLLPEEIRASLELPVETWSLADLGVAATSVGLAASPTYVGRLLDEAPHRTSHRFDQGTVEDRVRAALGRAAELLERARPPGVPGIPLPGAKVPASARFLVLATGPDGAGSDSAMDAGAAIHDVPTGWTVVPVWVGS
ncbi:MAG: electron transfer flavoprotein subunit beta/FixA family protein, partial [Thermoplasmata archaeon]|nr:electron transfer flavoprotein subunit beta/FixA family protein [Thermoplasmata archaeon]